VIIYPPLPNATNPPLLAGAGLGVRSVTKRQVEVTMFTAGVGTLEDLQVGKLVES